MEPERHLHVNGAGREKKKAAGTWFDVLFWLFFSSGFKTTARLYLLPDNDQI